MGRGIAITIASALIAAVALGGCSGDGDDDRAADETSEAEVADAVAEAPGTGACDPADEAHCLLPWPSDDYTRADPDTATGRRLDLPAEGMPANVAGVRIDPTEWNRNDGFSPASIPLTVIPGVDPTASELAPVTDIEASLAEDSSLVLVDVDTGERLAAWAELDPAVADPQRRPLRMVPAAALPEGHQVAVGLVDLRHADGTAVEPDEATAALLADPEPGDEDWLAALETAGAPRDELDAAWSFTVASTESLTGRLRAMWSDTRDELGDGAPSFGVTSIERDGGARVVQGHFEMPSYLTGDGGPGSVLANDGDPDGIPERTGTMPAEFTCVLPDAAPGAVPAVLYGHGLLGSRDEVLDIGSLGASVGIGFCALDWIGMSTDDIATVLEELTELSRFRTQPDRMQQGHLGFLLLGRLLADDQGFAADPAFQRNDGSPLVDPERLSFLGASQGGILGGPLAALSAEVDRAVFAVGGLGYNLLLRRSIDFDQFAPVLDANYPDRLDQAVALELMEQLWDRGENAAWARHVTAGTFPEGGGPTEVLLLEAFGDHQVANVSTQKLARTMGVPRRAPTLAPGRSPDREPYALIDEVPSLPHGGSALVSWDFGTPTPPTANEPPRAGEDPHGKLAEVPAALALVAAFIEPDGQVIDVCGGAPCSSPG